jgi:hypothetical protein
VVTEAMVSGKPRALWCGVWAVNGSMLVLQARDGARLCRLLLKRRY